jgi:hypothetical protein
VDTWVMHALAHRVLGEVKRVAQGHGIPLLPVKGIVTAHLLYDDVAHRPISDLDLRTRPADIRALRHAGLAAGWRLLRWSAAYQSVVFQLAGMQVDIETSVGPPGLCELAVEDMLARAEPGSGWPEIHDHALLLCVNAFKDKLLYAHPWALEDLVRVVRAASFDPDRFVTLASNAGAATLSWVVADWMTRVRGSVEWSVLRERLSPVRRQRYALVVRELIKRNDPFPFPLRVLARLANDRPKSRARAAARMTGWQAELWGRRWRAQQAP